MRSELTDITVVLDRSGSMASIQSDVIGGFNTFIEEQKTVPGECKVTLVQFDTNNPREMVYEARDLSEVPALNTETFVPRGGTPLLDCLGWTIKRTGERLKKIPEQYRPGHVIFVIITDEEENSSTEYQRNKIFDMISHQQSTYSWRFVFLAANQDAIQAGGSIGIAQQFTMTYAPSAVGTRAAYSSASTLVSAIRTNTSTQGFTDQDRMLQEEELAKDTGSL